MQFDPPDAWPGMIPAEGRLSEPAAIGKFDHVSNNNKGRSIYKHVWHSRPPGWYQVRLLQIFFINIDVFFAILGVSAAGDFFGIYV